jgi:hypothetical protein
MPEALKPLDMNGQRITELGDPAAAQDAVTRAAMETNYAHNGIESKGDMLVGAGAGALTTHYIGTNGRFLKTNNGQPSGMQWSFLTLADLPLPVTQSQSANFTADNAVRTYILNNFGAITVSLPPLTSNVGTVFTFKRTGLGAASLVASIISSDNIDGMPSYPMAERYQSVTILGTAGGWLVTEQAGLILTPNGTNWLGPEIPLPLVNYQGAQPYTANTEAYGCAAISDRPFLVTRFEIGFHVFTTNNSVSYWLATLRRLNSGIGFNTIGTCQTFPGTNDTWTHPTATTSFTNNPAATTDIFWQVNMTKAGSTANPGNAFILPTVKGRQVYT